MSQVNIAKGFIDKEPDGMCVLRGILELGSLSELLIAPYQREQLKPVVIDEMVRDLERGDKFQDITLCLRKGGTAVPRDQGYILGGEMYLTDGQQRVAAYKQVIKRGNGRLLRVGVKIHLDTTEDWERRTFDNQNLKIHKLSPNVLLHNWAKDYDSARVIVELCEAKPEFALYQHVQWTSYPARKRDLITAASLARTVSYLHAHLGAHGVQDRLDVVVESLDDVIAEIGIDTFLGNIYAFFEVIDKAYGIRNIAVTTRPTYMLPGFLACVARILSVHTDFWQDTRLAVPAQLVRKLGNFPYDNPSIRRLASKEGSWSGILYGLLFNHMNKNRTNLLVPRSESAQLHHGMSAEAVRTYFRVINRVATTKGANNGKELAYALNIQTSRCYAILEWFASIGLVGYVLSDIDNQSKEWSVVQSRAGEVGWLFSERTRLADLFFRTHTNPTLREWHQFLHDQIEEYQTSQKS